MGRYAQIPPVSPPSPYALPHNRLGIRVFRAVPARLGATWFGRESAHRAKPSSVGLPDRFGRPPAR